MNAFKIYFQIKVPLVGARLVTCKFSVVEFAVVSRPKRESHVIKDNSQNAVEIRPSNNDNLIMRIPKGTFGRSIYTHLKVYWQKCPGFWQFKIWLYSTPMNQIMYNSLHYFRSFTWYTSISLLCSFNFEFQTRWTLH